MLLHKVLTIIMISSNCVRLKKVTANFDSNGLLESVAVDGQLVALSQNLMWYKAVKQGSTGNYADDRPSGAYVFRPSLDLDAMPVESKAALTVVRGPVVQEVHQQFNDWCSQVVRIYKGRPEIEIEWTVGPIPVDDDALGKEIISRVTAPGFNSSNGLFYTDSNGRQTLERRRNYRPTWPINVTEPVASNYYPINSHIYITNGGGSSAFVALVTDRSQGGTSLQDGQLELMVNAYNCNIITT